MSEFDDQRSKQAPKDVSVISNPKRDPARNQRRPWAVGALTIPDNCYGFVTEKLKEGEFLTLPTTSYGKAL